MRGREPPRPLAHDPRRRRQATRGWRSNPRERCGSPIQEGVLVAGAGRAAAAAARADETEQRMVVRKRRNAPGPSPTGARVNGGRRDEPPSTSANAREVASLNQAPDGRTRDTKGTPRLLNADHCSCHALIVSQSSHRLNRLVRAAALLGRRRSWRADCRSPGVTVFSVTTTRMPRLAGGLRGDC